MKVFERTPKGKTIIMATHDNTLAPHFTKTIHILDGEIISIEDILIKAKRKLD
jgi:ABC-type lipoprotein export system ATPase subunit